MYFFFYFNLIKRHGDIQMRRSLGHRGVDSSTAAWQRVGSSVCVGPGATEGPSRVGGAGVSGCQHKWDPFISPLRAYGGPLSSAAEAELMQFVGMSCHFTQTARPHWGQQKTSKGSVFSFFLFFQMSRRTRWSASIAKTFWKKSETTGSIEINLLEDFNTQYLC